MIVSSEPTAARSRIAEDRVIRNSGRPPAAALAQVGDQRSLGGLIQLLFDHVDDQDRRTFGFETDEQRDQRS